MKYMISWFERPQGSPAEYENAQKRILEVFTQDGRHPANFKIELFVVRVGEWGGHMLVDCDDPTTVHKVCSTLACFCIRGTTRDSRRGRCAGGTRNDYLARWTETQVTFERITSHLPSLRKMHSRCF